MSMTEEMMMPEQPLAPTKYEQLEDAYAKKKKKLTMNIIEFCVGGILLVFCLNYLMDHPAEKSSIVSGVEVLYQRARVFVSNLTQGKGKLLERKFEMQRGFNELIFMGEDGECLSESDLRKLYSYRDNLEGMDAEIFERQQFSYGNFLQTYYQKILTNCEHLGDDLGDDMLLQDSPQE